MRRHLSCYFKGFPNFKELRMRLVTENDPVKVYMILDEIRDKYLNWDATTLPAKTVYDN